MPHYTSCVAVRQVFVYTFRMPYINLAVDTATKERIKGLSECLEMSQAATVRILSYADVKTATMIQRRAAMINESERADA